MRANIGSKSLFFRAKDFLTNFVGSSYIRGIALLSGGQTFAALIPILAAPILGRIYAPYEYALLAVFVSIAQILIVVASLQYQHAIIAERSNQRALSVLRVCVGLNTLISFIILIAVCAIFVVRRDLFTAFDNGWWLMLLPLSVLINSFSISASTFANRLEKYKIMTFVQIVSAVVSAIFSIALGILGWGSDGLMTALLVSQTVAAVMYLSWLLPYFRTEPLGKNPISHLKISALRNRRFPLYTLPGVTLSAISLQIPVLALSQLGAERELGAFNRARSLVSMPITLVGQAVGQGFVARASQQYREFGGCRALMIKSAAGMMALGILPFGILMVWGETIIQFYLGSDWKIAGTIAKILAPMLYLRFIVTPFVGVFQFTGRQKLAFILNVLYSALILTSILIAIYAGVGALGVITVFSIGYAFVYGTHLIISIWIS